MSQKAIVATVKLGLLEFEGLLLEDGSFGLTSKQVCALILDADIKSRFKDRLTEVGLTKAAQTLMPQGVEFDGKVAIQRDSKGGTPYSDVIRLHTFEKLLRVADKLGNKKASDIVDQLVGLSLQQLFSDAFKIKFDAEDRQDWLIGRQRLRETFRKSLTDSLKASGYTEGWQYGKFVHLLQSGLGIDDGTRDQLSINQIARLTSAQEYIGLAIEMGMEPYEALNRCLRKFA